MLLPAPTAGRGWRHIRLHRVVACLALLLVGMLTMPPARANDTSLEYRVKAGFLFNFAKFVRWPEEVLAPGAPLRIGLLAPPDVCGTIERALADKSVAGHPLIVERLTEMATKAPPHMVFMHRSITPVERRLGTLANGHAILVVGETPDFAAEGGLIGFTNRGDTLRFQVNLEAAEHAHLQLSGQLAGLAEIVRPHR